MMGLSTWKRKLILPDESYHMYLVIQCQQNGTFTKHQLNIKRKLQKSTGMLVLEI